MVLQIKSIEKIRSTKKKQMNILFLPGPFNTLEKVKKDFSNDFFLNFNIYSCNYYYDQFSFDDVDNFIKSHNLNNLLIIAHSLSCPFLLNYQSKYKTIFISPVIYIEQLPLSFKIFKNFSIKSNVLKKIIVKYYCKRLNLKFHKSLFDIPKKEIIKYLINIINNKFSKINSYCIIGKKDILMKNYKKIGNENLLNFEHDINDEILIKSISDNLENKNYK